MSTTIEYPLRYFGLDSAFCAQARPLSPAFLRHLARNSNRMAAQGGPMLNLCWDAREPSGATLERGVYSVIPSKDWQPIVSPLPAPHNPLARSATLYVYARITNGVRIYLQLTTSRWRFDLTPPILRVLTMSGDGTMQRYTLEDVPLGTSDFEPIGAYFKGDENANAANNSAPYSVTLATGTVTAVGFGYFEDNVSTQATNLSFPYFLTWVKFTDPTTGAQLWPAMRCDSFSASGGGGGRRFLFGHDYYNLVSRGIEIESGGQRVTIPANRDYMEAFNARILGATYSLVRSTEFQVASISLWEDGI